MLYVVYSFSFTVLVPLYCTGGNQDCFQLEPLQIIHLGTFLYKILGVHVYAFLLGAELLGYRVCVLPILVDHIHLVSKVLFQEYIQQKNEIPYFTTSSPTQGIISLLNVSHSGCHLTSVLIFISLNANGLEHLHMLIHCFSFLLCDLLVRSWLYFS